MKRSSQPRTTAELSKSLHQGLNTYALAASAAGVGMLALVQPAEAKIVYTPANVYIRCCFQLVPLDVNHDGVNDFAFSNGTHSPGDRFYSSLSVRGYKGNAVVLHVTGGGQNKGAADLGAGVSVGPNRPFSHRTFSGFMAGYAAFGSGGHSFFGPWAHGGKGVKNRYLGLKLTIKGEVHYGWARLTVSMGAPRTGNIVGHLTGYAYETIPNKPIITGKTKGAEVIDSAVEESNLTSLAAPNPKPATLDLLAIGAPALSIWRREESAGAAQ
jgi:hypothetical protein